MGNRTWRYGKSIVITFLLGTGILLLLSGLVIAWGIASYEEAEDEASIWYEVVEELPFLTVIASSPEDNETDVAVDRDISVTFDREIAQGAEFESISVKDAQDNTPVLISLKYIDGNILIIEPEVLEYGTAYAVIIPIDSVVALSDGSITLETDYSFSFTTAFQYGDVVGNGRVDVSDAIAILKHIVAIDDIEDLYGSEALIRADVNGDGKVDVADAILVLQYIVGIITEFPVEA